MKLKYTFVETTMKRLTLIFLCSLYAISILGVSIKKFYCCGKLKSITVHLWNDSKATCNKGDDKDGCCKAESKFFKVKENHIAFSETSTPHKYFCDVDLPVSTPRISKIKSFTASIANGINAPPDYKRILYIFNCVYRI